MKTELDSILFVRSPLAALCLLRTTCRSLKDICYLDQGIYSSIKQTVRNSYLTIALIFKTSELKKYVKIAQAPSAIDRPPFQTHNLHPTAFTIMKYTISLTSLSIQTSTSYSHNVQIMCKTRGYDEVVSCIICILL